MDDPDELSSNRAEIRSAEGASRVYAGFPRFIKYSDRVNARGDLSAGAKILYADLQNINQKENKGNVCPYQKTLAERHQLSSRQIRRLIDELEISWLLTDEKRGLGRSSKYHLHDSWNEVWADNLVLDWRTQTLERSHPSAALEGAGRIRPISEAKSGQREVRSVLKQRTQVASPKEKNYTRRPTRKELPSQKHQKHSVSAPPPRAASPERCECGISLKRRRIKIGLEGIEEWTPSLGRTTFVVDTGQFHFHPDPDDFLSTQLALAVHLFEVTHQRAFEKSGSRVRYHGSPYTSLDVQRGLLLTLEGNPDLAVTDLVRAARDGNLQAPTPRFFLKALQVPSGDSEGSMPGSSHLTAKRACRLGLHRSGIEGIELRSSVKNRSRQSARAPVPERSRSYYLAKCFDEQVVKLDPMGSGNVSGLAKQIAKWRREGESQAVIGLMIDEFIRGFRSYCPDGNIPWQRFVYQRHTLRKKVETQFVDRHRWDDDFTEKRQTVFGTKGK